MPPEQDIPRQIGPYEIVAAIGEGGMGRVYKAVEPSSNRIVAVKVLPPEFLKDEVLLERFHREALALTLVKHPNVVQILAKDRDGELLYFAMEYVPGTSLAAVLRRRRLSLPEALAVFKGICAGLEAAHQQNVIHRDLNPRNVLVSDDLSRVKLADFGISRVESRSREAGTLATVEFSMGTLHYVAPEQTDDMAAVDHRADIYSAGVVLYEMLTGRVPLGRFNLPSQRNSEVPHDLDPVVLKCLASEPSKRYATVGQLRARLQAVEDQLRLGLVSEIRGISRSTTNIFRRGTQKLASSRRRKVTFAVAAAVLLALTAGALLLTRQRPDTGQRAATPESSEAPDVALPTTETTGIPTAEEEALTSAAGDSETTSVAVGDSATLSAGPSKQARVPRETGQATSPARRVAPDARPAEAAERDFQVASDKVDAALYQPALRDLQSFIETHTESPLLPDAYLLIARIHQRESRIHEALATLVEVQTRFSERPQAAEALFLRGQLTEDARMKGRESEPRELFGEVARLYPDSSWAPQALVAKAAIERDQKIVQADPELGDNTPLFLSTELQLVESYPNHPAVESALWSLGKTYEDLKRFDLAAASYADLATRFPETRLDAWWEAARIYDKKLDNEAEALAAYRRVPPGSAHADAAQKRIKRLER
jgi:serine/threonine protein kinase/outer membrane protein assembly factor BamD (BamD/ComL family)